MTFFFSSLLTTLLTSLFLFSRCKGRSVDNHIHLIISSVFVIIVTTRSSITTTTRIMNHGHSDECRCYGLRISTSTTSICQLIHTKFPSSLGIISGSVVCSVGTIAVTVNTGWGLSSVADKESSVYQISVFLQILNGRFSHMKFPFL